MGSLSDRLKELEGTSRQQGSAGDTNTQKPNIKLRNVTESKSPEISLKDRSYSTEEYET